MANMLIYLPAAVFIVFFATVAIRARRRGAGIRRGVRPAEYVFFAVSVLVLAGGTFVSRHMAGEADRRQRVQLSARVHDIALSLKIAHLKRLSFSPADQSRPEFQRMTRQLRELSAHPGEVFGRLYTIARRHGALVFGPEGYEAEHPHAVTPGRVYENPPPGLEAVFTTGEPMTAGPYTDEFGDFVSAFFPVADPTTDEIILVAGLDIDAELFSRHVRAARTLPSAITAILLALLFALFLSRQAGDAPVTRRLTGGRLTASFTAAFGMTLTIFAALAARDAATHRQREEFAARARAAGTDIHLEMREARLFLELLAGLFQASEHVSAEEFATFAAPILESGTILALNWVPAVPAAAVGRFEAAARRDGPAGFHLWETEGDRGRVPVSGRDTYYPNLYHVSQTMFGEKFLGIDLGFEPARRRAMREATATGLASATDSVTLFAHEESPPGIIVFLPAESRTQKGFVTMTLRADTLVLQAFRKSRVHGIDAELTQVDAGQERTLFSTAGTGTWRRPGATPLSLAVPAPHFGKAYTVKLYPTAEFLAARRVTGGLFALAAGLLLTAMASMLAWFLSSRYDWLESRVARQTASLERELAARRKAEQKRSALEETISAIIEKAPFAIQLLDPGGYTVRVNPAFVKLFGTAPPADYTVLEDPNFARADAHRESMKRLAAGERISFPEFFYNTRLVSDRLPDNPRWIRAEGFPLLDDQGRVKNLVLMHEDITARKQAEDVEQRHNSSQQAVAEISAQLLTLTADTQDKVVEFTLQRLTTLLGVDRGYLFEFSGDLGHMTNTHEWCTKNTEPQRERLQNIPTDTLPWLMDRITQKKPLHVPAVKELPAEAQPERTEFSAQGIQSLLCLPMTDQKQHLIGFAGFDAVHGTRSWSEQEIETLQLVTNLLGTAMGRSQAQVELANRERQLEVFFSQSLHGFFLCMIDEPVDWNDNADKNQLLEYVLDHQRMTRVNQAMLDQYGASAEDFIGITVRELFRHDLDHARDIWRGLFDRGKWHVETSEQKMDGTPITIDGDYICLYDGQGRIIGHFGVQVEITDRKKMEAQLRHDALHDQLTGLANKAVIMDRLERAIAHGSRRPSDRFVLLFLDLDEFKKVNDSLGHARGDELLKETARRIAGCLRPEDTLARLGGDEFAVLLELMPEQAYGERVARRILAVMRKPFLLAGHKSSVTASIGICRGPEESIKADEYLRNADTAMYRAKREGKNRFAFFSSEMSEMIIRKMIEETLLLEAVKKKQFSVYYQPIVALASQETIGHEALLRWHHPEKGLVRPAEFIPLAEENGLIVNLGEWVLEEACRTRQEKDNKSALQVNVNISAKQLQSEGLVSKVTWFLKNADFPPQQLHLEITETFLMAENALETIMELKSLGVKIVIDDFGTGHASLAYLHRYPVDGLKIDRSLITEMPRSEKHLEIVKVIIVLGKTLRIPVTAEGVETGEQAEILKNAGCDFAQGFLYGKPEPYPGPATRPA